MVGLLGTVSGMVKAFNVIEAEGAGSALLQVIFQKHLSQQQPA